jgi:hemoglobin
MLDGVSDTLYERMGGAYGIAAAVDRLIDSLGENQTLNMLNARVKDFHAHFGPGYKFMVTAWIVEMTGGPKCYPGRDMVNAHSDLGLTDYEFDVTAHEIRNTLYKVGAERDVIDEFMKVIEAQRGKIVTKA